jgi:hypothetical protein
VRLDRHGREYYKPGVTTDPAVDPTDWEASFDGGETWVAAIDDGGQAAVAVITRSVTPKVRLLDNPEIVVRDAPGISLD